MERIDRILKRIQENQPILPVQTTGIEYEYACDKCKDGGFLHPVVNSQIQWAELIPCRYCASPNRIKKSLGVSSLDNTFASFTVEPGTENAYKAAKRLASGETEWKLLMIYGEWGNGKTHLLEAISNELWTFGIAAKIHMFPDFITSLKNTFDRTDSGQSFQDIKKAVCERPYLLLDDVGSAGSFTPWSLEQLEAIILHRYRENLFTVLTSNRDYSELPRFIVSRFSDRSKCRFVHNSGKDFRPSI